MKGNRIRRVVLPAFVSACLAGFMSPSAGRSEPSAAEGRSGASQAEDSKDQEVLVRGNVRMTRRKDRAPAEPGPARNPRPVTPVVEDRPISGERIFTGEGARWLLDELVVGYRKGTTRRQKDQLRLDRGLQRIAAKRDKLSKLEAERIGLPSRLDRSGLDALMAELRAVPFVEYVEPNFVVEDAGPGPLTTADLAETILDAVDHGEDAFRFQKAGSEQARAVRDALVYARRNSGRGSGGSPVAPASGESPIPGRKPVYLESKAIPPPVQVYQSSRCDELARFLREDAVVRARISLPAGSPLESLTAVERNGARIAHLVYRWNDHSTQYPVSAEEDLISAVKGLKAARERYVAQQVESLEALVADFKPLDEEQAKFRQALENHRDAYRREGQDLAVGLFRIDEADVFLPAAMLRSADRQTSLRLRSCAVSGDSFLDELPKGEVAARVAPLLDFEQMANVVAASEGPLPAPSTWMPSMGLHRVDLRATSTPKTLKSYFWWNDATGFEHPHRAYEHDIRVLPWKFLECEDTWWGKIPDTDQVHLKQWWDVFITHATDRVWEGNECSRDSVLVHTKLPGAYVDIRLFDRTSFGKMFGVGTFIANQVNEYELYEVSFDIVVQDPTVGTATLVFQPQLGHWHSDYSGDETPPKEKSYFCSLSGQFCTSESCSDEETSEQACVFTSDSLTVTSKSFKNGELSIIPWSTNIGLYGGESEGKRLACRSDDTEPCRSVVQNINDKSTDRIREVYYSFDRTRDEGGPTGTYYCNKLGVPFDNGGGIYVHYWESVRLQDFKHPTDTGCERFGNDGETAIVYNPEMDRAFLLRDGMWEKYRSIQGPLQLGAPTGDEFARTGGAQQNFQRGCLIFSISTGLVEKKDGAACAKPPLVPDFRFAELGGLRVKSQSNRLEMMVRGMEAGVAAAADSGDFIDLELVTAEAKKTFLQALRIRNNKHHISLSLDESGGHADVPPPFERTDMADAFLHADVAMKFDLFGESGLSQETEIWTELVQQSPYWPELESKGFEEYPYWIIAATIVPGDVTATQTADKIVVEDVELNLNAGWWWQEPFLDLSGYSLSSGARNDLLQRLATYKTTLENIVKNYARDVVVPEMNRTENLDPRYKRMKSMYSAIVLAQWYKLRAGQNPKLPLAGEVDSEDLTGIEKSTPFDQVYWDGQADQLLWSGPCTTFWGTAECEIFGGVELSGSEPQILRDLTPDQEQMMALVLDDFGTMEEGDTHYLYGDVLTASTAELSLGEIRLQPGPYLGGRPVTLDVRVLNTGTSASGSFLVTVYDDVPNGQGQTAQYFVGQATLSLASMEAATAPFSWTFPQVPGLHTFTVVVDSGQAVGEANESDNSGTRALDVGSTSPLATIQFPVEGSVFTFGGIPFLVGTGMDPEEGELAADRLVWSSSINGPLGTGPELEEVALSVGEHTITLTVSDGEGLSAEDEIHIRIEPPALDFFTVTPCRVLDTRSGASLASMFAQVFPVAGLCDVPATAQAIFVNVTAIAPTDTGRVTLWPADQVKPGTSSINFPAGVTRSNNLILPLAVDGSGAVAAEAFVVSSGSVDLVVDVTGYFE